MSLKYNLLQCMKNKKMSIKELALATGISEPTLKRLRSQADTNPTLDVLMRLASALGVSMNDLIAHQHSHPVFYYGDTIALPNHDTELMILFTKKIFSFQAGSKALFKKHTLGGSITKYIINTDGKLFEKISDEKSLFRDEKNMNFVLNENAIFAIILKELYEVNYV